MQFIERFNKDFFASYIKLAQLILIWPPQNRTYKRILYVALAAINYACMPALAMLMELISLLDGELTYDQSVKTLSIFMLHVIYTFKLLSWFRDNQKLKHCIEILYRKSYNYENYESVPFDFERIHLKMWGFEDCRFKNKNVPNTIDTNNLENFWVDSIKHCQLNEEARSDVKFVKDLQAEITKETNIHGCVLIFMFYILAVIAIFFIFSDCIYESIMGQFFKVTHDDRQLPEYVFIPFDTNNMHGYSMVCFYQTIVALYVTTQYIGIDLFLWTMLIHMDGQLRVIQYAISSIRTVEDVEYICQMDVQFSKNMNEIKQIIDLLNILKNIYSIPLLLQYLFVIMVSCCVLYSMTQEDNVLIAIGMMGFAGCALTNSFFNLYYISQLTYQFSNVPNALYSIKWPGTNIRFQKQIISAMSRLQKTIGIDMGGMLPVNLDVFVKILQTTYSFFTLIQSTKTD